MGKPLIMSEIQIRFGPVIRDINFSMLERVHGTRINIDVWIKLLDGYRQATAFEKCPDCGGCQPFSK